MDLVNKNLKHYKKSMIDEYESHSSNDNSLINTNSNDSNQLSATVNTGITANISSFAKNNQKQSQTKQSSSNTSINKNVYCICKSSDTQRFMIGCDNCDDWYHGDCVGISESFTKNIKKFFCHLCRFKNPQLTIKYKKKMNEKEIREKYGKEINKREAKEAELLKKMNQRDINVKKHQTSKTNVSGNVKKEVKASSSNEFMTQLKAANSSSNVENKTITSAQQQNTENVIKTAITKEDIENFVSAIFKLGGSDSQNASSSSPNSLFANSPNSPLALGGSTLGASASASSVIFLPSSPLSNNNKLNKSPTKGSNSENLKRKDKDPSYYPSDEHDSNDNVDDNENDEYNNRVDEDDNDNNNNDDDDDDDDDYVDRNFKMDFAYESSKYDSNDALNDSGSYEPTAKKKRGPRKKVDIDSNNKKQKSINKTKSKSSSSRHHRHHHHRHHHTSSRMKITSNVSNEDEKFTVKNTSTLKQCLGPSCTEETRSGSKYCSDECGLKLAKKRILYFLNEKPLNDYIEKGKHNLKCVSDELNEFQLKKIVDEIEMSKIKLNEIEEKHLKLDLLLEKAKYEKIDENYEKVEKDIEETEIYCVTCGHSCNEKHALKHMEKCFNKYESQAFFGSSYKSHPDGRVLFCDYYNAQTKMYCKRLRAMCPEHEKEKKINEDEVCGCPLYKKGNIFEDSESICRAPKRKCQLHLKWDKIRRAQIDLEKLRLLMKLDELYEHKRVIESSLNNRNGFLSLLLHKTIKNIET